MAGFFGRPPTFRPGTWLLMLAVFLFFFAFVIIGIVYNETENFTLKICSFFMLPISVVLAIGGSLWNYYHLSLKIRDPEDDPYRFSDSLTDDAIYETSTVAYE
ncbi:hypothetical protein SNEBB_008884 [Seison nebaliae]|nr:hypothetical protein SNEBB_008884 [Seison nebaliae]